MNQQYLALGLAICVLVLFLLDSDKELPTRHRFSDSFSSPSNFELYTDEAKKHFNNKPKTQQDAMKKKEAYVSIMYGGTPRDYEYFLGARVMWQSLRESNTTRDMITLVSFVV